MIVHEAIERYHDLLDDQRAVDNFALLDEKMQNRHLAFGGRPLCTVLRPHFLTPAEYAAMKRACETILAACARLFEAMVERPELREEVGLTALEEQAFAIDPGYRTPSPTGRLDSFLTHEPSGPPTIHFVEYNAETPAGAGYEDVLGGAFFELPLMHEFQKQYQVTMIPVRQRVLQTLLAMHREAGGRTPPTIGIVDWADVPTTNEFEIFDEYFAEQGYDAFITAPERMAYDGKVLRGDGKRIDIIYKRVLGSELLQRYGLDHPIIHALRDGNVTMVNPFRCKVLHKKMSFALLSDERHTALYSAEQQAAIAAHVPWTRKVEPRKTRLEGKEIDLLQYAVDHREEFVLKPNDEYGGEGVVIGWESSAEEWDAALQKGLREPTVLQRKVKIAREDYPSVVNGKLDISERLVDLDPYLFDGVEMEGMLTRLAATTLLNVTAGGGSVTPSFLIEARN
ncbi:MAG: circularly permuted type 2 ATP-grasp protein [Anaerolineales bacterium]|nr:circularly permuted type 2 ATP-grasp protein [Anaerolineales bacterium]MCB9128992.1 circularly permuted type 2 ATP-grasp protein [Ardenticatenales bacterium]